MADEPSQWTQGHIIEGVVAGGEKIHGLTPDGYLLCGARGDDGSEPHDRNPGGHFEDELFTDETDGGCLRCAAAWRALAP